MAEIKTDLKVGDKIRISVALLKEMYDMPNHESFACVYIGAREGNDGEKVINLQTVESYELEIKELRGMDDSAK